MTVTLEDIVAIRNQEVNRLRGVLGDLEEKERQHHQNKPKAGTGTSHDREVWHEALKAIAKEKFAIKDEITLLNSDGRQRRNQSTGRLLGTSTIDRQSLNEQQAENLDKYAQPGLEARAKREVEDKAREAQREVEIENNRAFMSQNHKPSPDMSKTITAGWNKEKKPSRNPGVSSYE